ncbi:prenyl cysteine carboxyl [Colletotrichum truncatum]|uniref:Prenyl cysteine carboxyl n=1 Tax=Colletotrichum truncatum TaxID=5467 RepID=A0ACC3YK41_COLTU|nr:prenyl cysteine carboxyl [Colletotrichum truncatum]KAF6784344.1 prenyl cysteine carboxyl [Colletotrichum truncatum]
MSLSQISLAAAYLASTVGTYKALTPPNPIPQDKAGSASKDPQIRDSIHLLNFTNNHINKVVILPLALLSLHAAALAYTYPSIPPSIAGYSPENGLNVSLITWSASTAVPLALLFFVGVPLRLVPYRSLGKNFTFALTKPDGLKTTGIYSYVQHPSYTGVMVLVFCNLALYARMDGVLSCWAPPALYQTLESVEWASLALGGCMFFAGVWTRVTEEEKMLRGEFGQKWERWHAETARFVPGIF